MGHQRRPNEGRRDYLGAPEGLKQLEKEIDHAARTKRWITLDELTLRQMVRDGWAPSAQERAQLLRKALHEDDVSVIKELLQNGADPNATYYGTNMTPLMIAQSSGAARALLDAGANPSARTERGVTALRQAVHFAPDLTQVLLKAGLPADQQDADGSLLEAACVGNAGAVKLLLWSAIWSSWPMASQSRGSDQARDYRSLRRGCWRTAPGRANSVSSSGLIAPASRSRRSARRTFSE
jgi:hypothetical protein